MTQILLLAVPLALVPMGQTHALLVGYLDLSVGAMVTLGVVIASFLIGPEASPARDRSWGWRRSCCCGVVARTRQRRAWCVGLKIPSIIATLATLSILNGISLTLRPTPGGIINSRLHVSAHDDAIGPIPIAFIVVVVGGGAARTVAARERVGPAAARGRARRTVGEAQRRADDWVRVRALVLSALFAAVASFFLMARSAIGQRADRRQLTR